MNSPSIKGTNLLGAVLIIFLIVCLPVSAAPTILITVVPTYDPTGSLQTRVYIEGKVSGVDPKDYWVVIYTLTDTWYVQPDLDSPFTAIRDKGLWSAQIRSGARYAALLVRKDSGFKPPSPARARPSGVDAIVAETEVQGQKDAKKSP